MIDINDDDVRICKICNRRFSNGKAMGGHMRSHLAKLPLPSKPPPPPSSSPMHSSNQSHNDHLICISKPNLQSDDADSQGANPTRTRSKRSRKSADSAVDSSSPEQVSSVSTDKFTEGDIAMCLLMLSKDRAKKEGKQVIKKHAFEDNNDITEEIEDGDEDDDDDDESFPVSTRVRSKPQGKYKCMSCNKGFRSYQALGGHKASHKKIKIVKEEEYDEGSGACHNTDNVGLNMNAQRIFKCPFCDRVFESGQALGGHKKVHFAYLPVVKNFIDLNLPAPEDDGEVSQV